MLEITIDVSDREEAIVDKNSRILLEVLITEREGMMAENAQREALGQSMAYDYRAFHMLSGDMLKMIRPEEREVKMRTITEIRRDLVRACEEYTAVKQALSGGSTLAEDLPGECMEIFPHMAENVRSLVKKMADVLGRNNARAKHFHIRKDDGS